MKWMNSKKIMLSNKKMNSKKKMLNKKMNSKKRMSNKKMNSKRSMKMTFMRQIKISVKNKMKYIIQLQRSRMSLW